MSTIKPASRFKHSPCAAVAWHEGERAVWQNFDWSQTDQAKKEPGKFELKLTDPAYRYQLRVASNDYLPDETPLFDPDGSPKTFDFRLKKANPITGTIVDTSGKAVADAKVFLINVGDWMLMENGTIDSSYENSCPHVNSDHAGRFSLPPQKDNFAILVVSNSGTTSITRDQLAQHPALQLEPWAKLHGTVYVGGKPASKIDVTANSDVITIEDGTQIGSRQYSFTTDQDGHFELPRVSPGPLILKRTMPNHSPGRMWYVSLAKIDVKPGADDNLNLGQGISITGQLQIPTGKQWMIRQSRLEPKGQPHAEGWENVEVLPDGQIRADGLQPGDYVLHIALHEFPPNNECGWGKLVGEYQKDISITTAESQLNVGTIEPQPIVGPELKVGDASPDFTVQTLDGKTLHLADLKGKTVLLDFWAGWCTPCVEEIPNLVKIKSAYGSDPNFTMIGISLDENEKELRRFIKLENIDWTQSMVSIDSATVQAYGATAIPAIFLIGPDGRIPRDLRGENLQNAIAIQLAKK